MLQRLHMTTSKRQTPPDRRDLLPIISAFPLIAPLIL